MKHLVQIPSELSPRKRCEGNNFLWFGFLFLIFGGVSHFLLRSLIVPLDGLVRLSWVLNKNYFFHHVAFLFLLGACPIRKKRHKDTFENWVQGKAT